MSPEERGQQQKERVLASFGGWHNEYAPHPLSRAVERGTPSVAATAQSIRELGEMLTVADEQLEAHPSWLAEIDRLHCRLNAKLRVLKALLDSERAAALGV